MNEWVLGGLLIVAFTVMSAVISRSKWLKPTINAGEFRLQIVTAEAGRQEIALMCPVCEAQLLSNRITGMPVWQIHYRIEKHIAEAHKRGWR